MIAVTVLSEINLLLQGMKSRQMYELSCFQMFSDLYSF